MSDVFLAGCKYLVLLMFAFFTYNTFKGARNLPEKRKRRLRGFQKVLMLLTSFALNVITFINVKLGFAGEDADIMQYIYLYAGELVYYILMLYVLPAVCRFSHEINSCICMLSCIGLAILTRLSFKEGTKHFIILVASTVVFLIVQAVARSFRKLRNLTWIYCILGLALLMLVMVLATAFRGAKLSIDLGFFSFQPMEFVKILFVLFVASAFNKSSSFKTVFITTVFAAAHVLIQVVCTDLGSALILFVVYILMLYVATRKFIYVVAGGAAFAVACVAAYMLFGHVQTRVNMWLDPWVDLDVKGYQITQSLFAIGTGGWLGSGLFRGNPADVPMAKNDFIFAAVSEEFGGLFSVFLILLNLAFVYLMFKVAMRVRDNFYKLVAFGIGSTYAFQVFLTIGGAVKFIPSTGVNLPFLSSGGSSLLASMIMLGLIQALYVKSEQDVAEEIAILETGGELINDKVVQLSPEYFQESDE